MKRGRGGSLDIEFIVQALQLQSAGRDARVVVPGTLEAIEALARGGFLSEDDAAALAENYRFPRRIESAVRLLNTDARHDLPAEEINLRKLAMLIRWDEPEGLADRCQQVMEENRQRFDRLLSEETPDNP